MCENYIIIQWNNQWNHMCKKQNLSLECKSVTQRVTSEILQNLDSEHCVTRLLAAEQAAEKPEQSLSTN